MAGAADLPAALVVVGASHRSAPAALRDRLFVADADAPAFLRGLVGAGMNEALILSTCDRVEVHAIGGDTAAAATAIGAALAERAALDPGALAPHLYRHEGAAAVRHVFDVAAALDSQIVGEPQVLGQLKAAHRLAAAAGAFGPGLEAVLQAAYGAAKRVRSETAIGERPVSIAAAACQLARDIHGDLSRATALLLGDGEMGELIAAQLHGAGLRRLLVAAPVDARAAALAERLDCHVVPWAELPARLADAEIVVAGLGGRSYVISAELLGDALKRRRHRPMFLVDAAVPGDVDPAIDALDEAFRYDLDALERVALDGRDRRVEAAAQAKAIVEAAVAAFVRSRTEREAAPTIAALRAHFERLRREVLEAGGDAPAEELTRRLVNRLLHDPSEALRDVAAGADESIDRQRAEQLVRRLFKLDADDGE
ncbi:MAG: glutamyl-tRNA reductase [Candidatus Eiseniibacteriota bacterium]